jgi:hypothetical protein
MAVAGAPRVKASQERPTPHSAPIQRYEQVVTVADQSAARAEAAAGPRIAIVERGVARWAVFQCPCGCRELVTINLDKRTDPHWRLTRKRDWVTLIPSVWRESGCLSHFIVWKNRVWMFRRWRLEDDEDELPKDIDTELLTEWNRRRSRRR